MTILIVEDSPLELRRVCRLVAEASPEDEICSFSDSAQARDRLLQHTLRPDTAFLDIEMPPPDGTELAQLLLEMKPETNIIFTTAYASYMKQAFGMFVSGYLLKPFSLQDVQAQLANLRHPVCPAGQRLFARTAGEFDFCCDGRSVPFTLSRAKEMLAYLIDRRGAAVTKRELFSVLFAGEEYSAGKQDHMKKIAQALKLSLQQVGAEQILRHARNSYAVDMTLFDSDLREHSAGNGTPYMEQYAWARGR